MVAIRNSAFSSRSVKHLKPFLPQLICLGSVGGCSRWEVDNELYRPEASSRSCLTVETGLVADASLLPTIVAFAGKKYLLSIYQRRDSLHDVRNVELLQNIGTEE